MRGARLLDSRLVGLRQNGDGTVEEAPVEHLLLLRVQQILRPAPSPWLVQRAPWFRKLRGSPTILSLVTWSRLIVKSFLMIWTSVWDSWRVVSITRWQSWRRRGLA